MPRKSTTKSETIVYKGIAFRRYPDSPNWCDKSYYRPGASHTQAGVKSLHQEIWQDAYGPIPAGHEIHHRDGNPINNALENLECLTPEAHAKHHAENISEGRMEELRKGMDRARIAASAWHRSEEGRAWHRTIATMPWENAEYRDYNCQQCGKGYQSRETQKDHSRFCSNACKSAWRRGAGIDNETRICGHCNQEFICNKYAIKAFCSIGCKTRARFPDSVEEPRSCPICNGTFSARRSSAQKYCSRTCTSRSRLFYKQK